MRMRVSILTPKAFSMRRAMLPESEAWPFRRLDKAGRETRNAAAAAVTESPAGSMISVRIKSPGCGGVTMTMKNPPHPGDFIRTEIIEPAGLSVTAAAAALRVSRPALSSLLNGQASLSGNMSLRIEKAFGVKMDTHMRMRSSYGIAQTRLREKQIRVRRLHLAADVHA